MGGLLLVTLVYLSALMFECSLPDISIIPFKNITTLMLTNVTY